MSLRTEQAACQRDVGVHCGRQHRACAGRSSFAQLRLCSWAVRKPGVSETSLCFKMAVFGLNLLENKSVTSESGCSLWQTCFRDGRRQPDAFHCRVQLAVGEADSPNHAPENLSGADGWETLISLWVLCCLLCLKKASLCFSREKIKD